MFCQSCGMEVASSYQFCPKCGGKQFGSSTSNVASRSSTGSATTQQTAYSQPASGYSSTGTYASFWRRLGAYVIDYVLVLIGAMLGGLVLGMTLGAIIPSHVESVATLLGYILGLLVGWLYFALLESGPQQSTLGKRWLGMRVTDENGQRISFGKATGRYFSKIISGIILAIGYLMVLWTERRQALHDKMAGTYVIYAGGR